MSVNMSCDYCDEPMQQVPNPGEVPDMFNGMEAMRGIVSLNGARIDLHPECIEPFMSAAASKCKGKRPKKEVTK